MDGKDEGRIGQGGPRAHLDEVVLSAYLDESAAGLPPGERALAAEHLAACAACRDDLADLAETLTLLRALPQVAPRRSFILTPEAVAAVGGPRLPRRTPRWLWPTRWATALAAIIFAITLGLGDGAPAAPATAAAPAATRGVAVSCVDEPVQGCLNAQGVGTPIVFPTPTPLAAPGATVGGPGATATDWRPLRVASGLVALLGAICGFLLPPVLRRRGATAA